ncbi:MAG: hypothetical protein QOE92_1376 [Chloroflexota bacterium]|nr:hypothetical protein [Chloroflexota bacterium]
MAPGEWPGERLSYVLPIATEDHALGDLPAYLASVAATAEVIVVDGSGAGAFDAHGRALGGIARHIPPRPALVSPMGKVGGVLTGVAEASHDRVVIADDDVRYDSASLAAMAAAVSSAAVVRPQNYFDPLPWHAAWDTGRSLVNRALDGDWPGTMGVRRSNLLDAGGYAGDVMFENLELVRTIRAAGGRERVAREILVRRLPPTPGHFWRQRVRQAYDELARPRRLALFLAIAPLVLANLRRRPVVAAAPFALAAALAAAGRRRDGGGRVFPAWTPAMAPLWLAERAVTSWMALGSRLLFGGIRYRGAVLQRAASRPAELARAAHLQVAPR